MIFNLAPEDFIMSSFARLPPLIKGRILGYLKESEYRKVRTVAKEWDNLFSDNIGLGFTITNLDLDILQKQVQNSRKIARLIFCNLTLPLGQNIKIIGSIGLTSLTFDKITTSYNVIWSLIIFKNLRKLTFNLVLLETTKLGVHNSSMALPFLESISIVATTGLTNPDGLENSLTLRSGNAIIEFLSKLQYKKLREVSLFCPWDVLSRMPLNQLFDFYSDLKDMSGLVWLLYNNRTTMEEFTVWTDSGDIAVKFQFQPLKGFWKKPMQILAFDSYINFPKEWDVLFHTQNHFRYVRMNGAYNHWAAVQGAILRSSDHVTEVYLAGGGFGSTVSLSGFKNCKNLTTLNIFLDDCYLQNIEDLPMSLKELSLSGPLTLKDLTVIANRLEKLEDLYITDNLPSAKYKYYGENTVIPGTLSRALVEDFMSLPVIRVLTFRECQIEVPDVIAFLRMVNGIKAEIFPVRGYPRNTIGSMNIEIHQRQ